MMAIPRVFPGVVPSHDAPARQDAPLRCGFWHWFPGADSKRWAAIAGAAPCASAVLAIALLAGERSAEARITRVVFTTVQSPTFGGTSFDAVGPYEKLAGRAATYTGWALRASAFAGNDLCDAAGQQIPFLRTEAERQAAGDPRPSLAERYGTHARYVKQFARAGKRLRRHRLLLPEDAVALTMAAEAAAVP